jgi:hypothetical protein
MTTKQLRETRKIELVETHNIALALNRLEKYSQSWDSRQWKRALYHALCMSSAPNDDHRRKIREALELP